MKFLTLTLNDHKGLQKIFIHIKQIISIVESDTGCIIRCRNGENAIVYVVQESILEITKILNQEE